MTQPHLPVLAVDSAAHPDSPTAGIQEAIDSLPKGGGTVFIPRGVYTIRHSIVVGPDVTLQGEGNATVLQRPAPIVFDITTTTPADDPEKVELSSTEGLAVGDEIYLRDATQGGWHARHITIRSIDEKWITGTLVEGDPKRRYGPTAGALCGTFFPMILIRRCSGATIADLTISGGTHGVTPEKMPGFTCSAVHGVHAEDLRVRNVTVRQWPCDGISAQKGSAIVTGCIVEDCTGHGYHPGSGIARSIWSNNFSHRNGGDGFFFCQAVRNAVVSGNVFSDNRMNGIGNLSDPDAYNTVTGNTITGNGQHGIEGFAAIGNVIANNVIRNNSQAGAGKFAGIRLESHKDNSITGNVCLDTQDEPTQLIGIELIDPAGDNTVGSNHGEVVTVDAVFPPPPSATIPFTNSPPPLDGDIRNRAWGNAAPLPLDRRVDDGSPVEITATAQLLYDHSHLYIGVHCNEPLMANVDDSITENGGGVWSENCIEIYLMPDAKAEACMHFAVNSLGTLFERCCKGSAPQPPTGSRAAAHKGNDHWSITIAIPLATLPGTTIKPGSPFKANLYRTRQTTSPPERSCWSPTRASFLMPRRFGTLTCAG